MLFLRHPALGFVGVMAVALAAPGLVAQEAAWIKGTVIDGEGMAIGIDPGVAVFHAQLAPDRPDAEAARSMLEYLE